MTILKTEQQQVCPPYTFFTPLRKTFHVQKSHDFMRKLFGNCDENSFVESLKIKFPGFFFSALSFLFSGS